MKLIQFLVTMREHAFMYNGKCYISHSNYIEGANLLKDKQIELKAKLTKLFDNNKGAE